MQTVVMSAISQEHLVLLYNAFYVFKRKKIWLKFDGLSIYSWLDHLFNSFDSFMCTFRYHENTNKLVTKPQ